MNDRISAQLADAHHGLREQLASAEKHFERLEKLLAQRDCRDIADLNRAVRRLRQHSSQWSSVLVETTQGFCDRAALFTRKGALQLEAARNIPMSIAAIDANSAAAFRTAIDTRDTVVAVRSAGELSRPLAELLGEAADRKCYLFPISTRYGVKAVLYADSDQTTIHADALELLANVAGAVLDARPAEVVNGLVHIARTPQPEGDMHRRAKRFARVRIAEIRLYQSDVVKKGRSARDLYTSLKTEIDSARDIFRRDFLSASGSMTDYLHLELLQTLANGEVELLGPQYPGPLV